MDLEKKLVVVKQEAEAEIAANEAEFKRLRIDHDRLKRMMVALIHHFGAVNPYTRGVELEVPRSVIDMRDALGDFEMRVGESADSFKFMVIPKDPRKGL